MARIVSYKKDSGKLTYVDFLMTEQEEKEIYNKFLHQVPDGLMCNGCGRVVEPEEIDDTDYRIRVYNPLQPVSMFGFTMGFPYITCPDCGQTTELTIIDVAAYPDIDKWLKALMAKVSSGQKEAKKSGGRVKNGVEKTKFEKA